MLTPAYHRFPFEYLVDDPIQDGYTGTIDGLVVIHIATKLFALDYSPNLIWIHMSNMPT